MIIFPRAIVKNQTTRRRNLIPPYSTQPYSEQIGTPDEDDAPPGQHTTTAGISSHPHPDGEPCTAAALRTIRALEEKAVVQHTKRSSLQQEYRVEIECSYLLPAQFTRWTGRPFPRHSLDLPGKADRFLITCGLDGVAAWESYKRVFCDLANSVRLENIQNLL